MEASSSRRAAILLDEAVQDVASHETTDGAAPDRVLDLGGDPLVKALVRALPVVMGNVFAENPSQVLLADDNEVVEDLPANAADESFRVSIFETRAHADDFDARVASDFIEQAAEVPIAVVKEKLQNAR